MSGTGRGRGLALRNLLAKRAEENNATSTSRPSTTTPGGQSPHSLVIEKIYLMSLVVSDFWVTKIILLKIFLQCIMQCFSFLQPAQRPPSRAPQASSPRPQAPSPRPQVVSPRPQVASPRPQAPSPRPQAPNPRPQLVSPRPQGPSPKTQASQKPQGPSPRTRASPKPQEVQRDVAAAPVAGIMGTFGRGRGLPHQMPAMSLQQAHSPALSFRSTEFETSSRKADSPKVILNFLENSPMQIL